MAILTGLKAISSYYGSHTRTVRYLVEREKFPAAKGPDGKWRSRPELIDAWVDARIREGIADRAPTP